MNQGEGKTGFRRERGLGRSEHLRELIGATALTLIGLFFLWQAWLILSELSGAKQAEQIKAWEVRQLGEEVARIRSRVQQAVDSASVAKALASQDAKGLEEAAATLRQIVPEAVFVEFFRPDVSDVLTSNFSKFGYSKAAMIVQAHRLQEAGPLQSQIGADKKRLLALALPAARDKQVLAYAYVQMPIDPLLHVFRQQDISGARIDLRQGEGRGDFLLDSIGSDKVSTMDFPGDAIADSAFRVASAQPELPILVSRRLWLVLSLAVFSLALGMFLWYARKVGWARIAELLYIWRPASMTHSAVLAQIPVAAAANGLKAKVSARTRADSLAGDAQERDISVDRSIFRAYDIRGVVGKTLTKGVARLIGRAIGSEARARDLHEIVVARDGRLSGPDLVGALIEGLRSTGCDVIDIGAAATPLLYFATFQLNTGSGVMVTGSHNPPDYNGFKIVLGGETLSEDAIQNLYARISESKFETGSGGLQSMNVQHDYVERIANDVQVERKLKVVVDCGNGIAGIVAPAVLEAIGCEVTPLFCDVDGKFPNHHPDPSDARNLQDLILSVKQLKADLGVAFDGDGDRLGVVTASGEIIYPDRLLMLFARDVLSRNPGAAIIYDVKCTGKLQPLILEAGGSPIMWKTGHSLIKAKMRQTGAELAGEMSGHFFFKERWYGFDDGIYSAARLLEIVASDIEGRTPQEVFDELPKSVSTPELKMDMEEGEHYRFVETFQQKSKLEGARITTIDGVRADWPDGWGLVRASNTTPVLVMRFEADNEDALLRIQAAFRGQLLALNPDLHLPF